MVQSLCGLGLVDGGPVGGELGWAELPVGGVGSVDVEVGPPVPDDHPCFEEAVELPQVEQLVAEAAVSSRSRRSAMASRGR